MKKSLYILFVICVILLLSAGCSNNSMLIDGEITESGTTEGYYGGSPDFRLTRMIAENYLMENMEHYDWEGAVIGDFYPLYNPATDKITYLEYKVTKDGADRGYILVTLKDDETGVVESSHGENGTCYELLRERAGTGEIKAYRFSFASYVAESKNVTRAGERKILAALGNIEYELNGATSGGETLSRSRGAVDKYEELIRSYKGRTAENGGYLDIKKEYGEYLKKQKEDTTRTAPTHKEDKTAEIQWYWDETNVDVTYDSLQLRVILGHNPISGIGGTYSVRCYFLNGTYQDITFPLSLTANVKVTLNRTDLLRVENIKFSGYMYGDLIVRLYRMKLNYQEQVYSFNSSSIPYNWGVLWQNATTRIHYPLMNANQFYIPSGKACGCVPVSGAVIAAYWEKIKGIDIYPGIPTSESGNYISHWYNNFYESVSDFRYFLHMPDSGVLASTALNSSLGDAFWYYSKGKGIELIDGWRPCYYESLLAIDGAVTGSPGGANLSQYSYNRLIWALSNNWPASLGYFETEGHSCPIYKVTIKVDTWDLYYEAILSIDPCWRGIPDYFGVPNSDSSFTKDVKASTYCLTDIEIIWR